MHTKLTKNFRQFFSVYSKGGVVRKCWRKSEGGLLLIHWRISFNGQMRQQKRNYKHEKQARDFVSRSWNLKWETYKKGGGRVGGENHATVGFSYSKSKDTWGKTSARGHCWFDLICDCLLHSNAVGDFAHAHELDISAFDSIASL